MVMNANELAEGILAIEERIFLTKKEHQLFQNSATMLRQQKAEIEALKAKTLTDNEIIEIWSGMETDTGEQNIEFARAILRKAQEK